MANLTDDQVNKARDVWCKSLGTPFTCFDIPLAHRCFNAVAPYLQFSWDEPTDEEMKDLGGVPSNYHIAIREFVRRRNAALLPKPVDPRREKILAALGCSFVDIQPSIVEEITDRVLRALDEVK